MQRIKQETLEILVGGFLLLAALIFIAIAYSSHKVDQTNRYTLYAKFKKVQGVGVGDDVRIGGVTVGSVAKEDLDEKTYEAILALAIDSQYQLPRNSKATINADGMIGGKYIKIEPGNDKELLKPEEFFASTRDVIDLEGLIREIINLAVTPSEAKPKDAPSAPTK
ncbi:MAG: outer membrane lipid asymmetry maintenance protein MlaD [Alphaproteobacteria bacterium]